MLNGTWLNGTWLNGTWFEEVARGSPLVTLGGWIMGWRKADVEVDTVPSSVDADPSDIFDEQEAAKKLAEEIEAAKRLAEEAAKGLTEEAANRLTEEEVDEAVEVVARETTPNVVDGNDYTQDIGAYPLNYGFNGFPTNSTVNPLAFDPSETASAGTAAGILGNSTINDTINGFPTNSTVNPLAFDPSETASDKIADTADQVAECWHEAILGNSINDTIAYGVAGVAGVAGIVFGGFGYMYLLNCMRKCRNQNESLKKDLKKDLANDIFYAKIQGKPPVMGAVKFLLEKNETNTIAKLKELSKEQIDEFNSYLKNQSEGFMDADSDQKSRALIIDSFILKWGKQAEAKKTLEPIVGEKPVNPLITTSFEKTKHTDKINPFHTTIEQELINSLFDKVKDNAKAQSTLRCNLVNHMSLDELKAYAKMSSDHFLGFIGLMLDPKKNERTKKTRYESWIGLTPENRLKYIDKFLKDVASNPTNLRNATSYVQQNPLTESKKKITNK